MSKQTKVIITYEDETDQTEHRMIISREPGQEQTHVQGVSNRDDKVHRIDVNQIIRFVGYTA